MRTKRILAWSGLLVVVIAGSSYLTLRDYEQSIIREVDDTLSSVQEWRPKTTCSVFDRNGEQVDSFYVERREWVSIDRMPNILWQTVVATEDRRFMSHRGVDPMGIARAMVSNYQAGGVTQGGSTLTQQLVKNLFLSSARTYERKAREAVIAWHLEKRLSKMEIMELYLNFIYLGGGNYGVEAASQDYFGVPVSEINTAQAALLAALIPAPSAINTHAHPELALAKRATALDDLVEVGILTQGQADIWKEEPIVTPRAQSAETVENPAYVTAVRREVRRVLGKELPFSLGLQVHTPFDPAIQQVVDVAIDSALAAHVGRQGPLGVRRNIPEADRSTFVASGPVDAIVAGECVEAMVTDDRLFAAGAHEWEWPRWKWRTRVAAYSDAWVTLGQVAQPGDVVSLCRDDEGVMQLDDRPWAQGAAVVMDNSTGEILALSGGQNVQLEGFIRATQARRQPGSTFKPYVYATAMSQGKSQLSTVMDTPIYFPGSTWSPENPSGYHGKVTLRRALAGSFNAPAVRLALEHDVENVAELAHDLGIESPLRDDLTLALGSSEVTTLDQVTAFATIARGGEHIAPVFIRELIDVNGDSVAVAGSPVLVAGETIANLPGARTRVLNADVAAELSDMLHHVVEAGTGRRTRMDDRWIAGKTGTTNRATDTWFVGFSPDYTIAVWVGTDDFTPLGKNGEAGSRTALPVFRDIMATLPASPESPRVPDSGFDVPTAWGWMTMSRAHAPSSVIPYGIPGSEPLEPYPVQADGWR
jgi:penicillin-binding protein 1A